MTDLLIAVPVLGRPHRAAAVVEAAEATDVSYRILFLCSPGDDAEIAACRATDADVTVVRWRAGRGDFARKANLAVERSSEPWVFVVGDDVCFCPGWASEAIRVSAAKSAGVVGTNDRANPRVVRGETATHNLVARWYAERYGTVERPGRVFHEGYDHNFVDDELVETAKARRSWAFARRSIVPHLHLNERNAPDDETYRKGRAKFADDRRLFLERRDLWRPGLPVAVPPDKLPR